MRDYEPQEPITSAYRAAVAAGSAITAQADWYQANGLRNDLWALDYGRAIDRLAALETGERIAEAQALRNIAKGAAIGWTQERLDTLIAERDALIAACAGQPVARAA